MALLHENSAPLEGPRRAAPDLPGKAAKGARGSKGRWRLTLSVKTTLFLLILLTTAVALCGTVFVQMTRYRIAAARRAQLQQFAYGLSPLIGDECVAGSQTLASRLKGVGTVPDIDFIAVTDSHMHLLGAQHNDQAMWESFQRRMIQTPMLVTGDLGQTQNLSVSGQEGTPGGGEAYSAVTVPILEEAATDSDVGEHRELLGYLHVGMGMDVVEREVRYVQGSVGLLCMFVVLLGFPLAIMLARHITGPIQQVAQGARALSDGHLAHRVFVKRADELGDLADAFNAMAHTVAVQRDAIGRINAGLETKVSERTAELEAANARLKTEMADKEDFLRAVSHDLNAPLRNISGMASMLLLKYKDTLEVDVVQRLERIQKNVDMETELINELLELSRIKTRREKIETVDLHALVAALGEQFSNDLEIQKIGFEILGRLPVMECEKLRLRQVFGNLIDNAIKYMRAEDPRRITLSATVGPEEVTFHVADTGIGVAAEDLPNLFHVFRRARSALIAKIPGKGVGLASVKSIVGNYQGRLWVESILGVGTTVHFAMPIKCFRVQHAPQQEEVAV